MTNSSNNTPALVALICGILAIVGGLIPVVQYFTTILAIVAIVFGVKGRAKAAECGVGNTSATVGLILGILGVFFAVCGLICSIVCAGTVASLMQMIESMQ